LTLVYGFNHDEAIRSFRRAAELDPNAAMPWWGIALAVGPNYNLDVDPEREKAAFDAIRKAQSLAANATENERAYIEALAKRYSNASKPDFKKLAVDYKNAMREVAKRYPDDMDAATIYAESMMDLRPWNLWTLDGKPAEDTEEIIAVLQSVLQRDPLHVGANHYYIHAVEASTGAAVQVLSTAQETAMCLAGATLGRLPRPDQDLRVRVRAVGVDPAAEQLPDPLALGPGAAGPVAPGSEVAPLLLQLDLLDAKARPFEERAPLLLGVRADVRRVVQPLGLLDLVAVVERVLDEHHAPRDARHLADCGANVREVVRRNPCRDRVEAAVRKGDVLRGREDVGPHPGRGIERRHLEALLAKTPRDVPAARRHVERRLALGPGDEQVEVAALAVRVALDVCVRAL
jgi:hypothetical protein